LFGVLGLIQQDDSQNRIWKPDYSLSVQHVFIGIVAHFLINLKMCHILRYAAGLLAPASSPSWMPDLVAPESWQLIFNPPEFNEEEMFNFISQNNLLTPGWQLSRLPPPRKSDRCRGPPVGWDFSPEWIDAVLNKKP